MCALKKKKKKKNGVSDLYMGDKKKPKWPHNLIPDSQQQGMFMFKHRTGGGKMGEAGMRRKAYLKPTFKLVMYKVGLVSLSFLNIHFLIGYTVQDCRGQHKAGESPSSQSTCIHSSMMRKTVGTYATQGVGGRN